MLLAAFSVVHDPLRATGVDVRSPLFYIPLRFISRGEEDQAYLWFRRSLTLERHLS